LAGFINDHEIKVPGTEQIGSDPGVRGTDHFRLIQDFLRDLRLNFTRISQQFPGFLAQGLAGQAIEAPGGFVRLPKQVGRFRS
jgi:hypothetical protein